MAISHYHGREWWQCTRKLGIFRWQRRLIKHSNSFLLLQALDFCQLRYSVFNPKNTSDGWGMALMATSEPTKIDFSGFRIRSFWTPYYARSLCLFFVLFFSIRNQNITPPNARRQCNNNKCNNKYIEIKWHCSQQIQNLQLMKMRNDFLKLKILL